MPADTPTAERPVRARARRHRPPRERIALRLDAGERAELDAIATAHGLAPAAVARLALLAGLRRVGRTLADGRGDELRGW